MLAGSDFKTIHNDLLTLMPHPDDIYTVTELLKLISDFLVFLFSQKNVNL